MKIKSISNSVSLQEQYDFVKEVLVDLRKLWIENPELRSDELKNKIFKYRNFLKQLYIEFKTLGK